MDGSRGSGVDLRALDRRARRALDGAGSDADAAAALGDFVSGFHDAHLRLVPKVEPAGSPAPALPPVAYDDLDAPTGVAALGYAIATPVAFSLPFEALRGSTLLNDGVSLPFRAAVVTTTKGMKLGLVRIPRFREQDSPPALAVKEWTARKKPGQPLDVPALKAAITDAWYQAMADHLKRFEREQVAAVIVDVGGNGGGNDAGDWMVRLFTAREVRSARLLMAASPGGARYFDDQLRGLRAALKDHPALPAEARAELEAAIAAVERRKASVESRKSDMSWVWREQRPFRPEGASRLVEAGFFSGQLESHAPIAPADRGWFSELFWPSRVDGFRGAWSGRVYVLTDGGTGSSAEMFTASMRDNRVGRIVGTPTLGAGAGFMGDAPPVELPHSRLRVIVPNCVRLRADGTDEVAGIQPDLPVLPTEGESGRGRAARVLETIEADLLAPGQAR